MSGLAGVMDSVTAWQCSRKPSWWLDLATFGSCRDYWDSTIPKTFPRPPTAAPPGAPQTEAEMKGVFTPDLAIARGHQTTVESAKRFFESVYQANTPASVAAKSWLMPALAVAAVSVFSLAAARRRR
jgi:hypothetical protein